MPKFLKDKGRMILLVKPQFEAGREALNRNGIVKHPDNRIKVLNSIRHGFEAHNYKLVHITAAPIYSKTMNIEYIAEFSREGISIMDFTMVVNKVFDLQKNL
ncbi:MAG TPA: hypothetical protein P5349_07310 [Tenuifilaceae bacterium]|nr:hypothetical protein [Tenuifilaceae bacterium]